MNLLNLPCTQTKKMVVRNYGIRSIQQISSQTLTIKKIRIWKPCVRIFLFPFLFCVMSVLCKLMRSLNSWSSYFYFSGFKWKYILVCQTKHVLLTNILILKIFQTTLDPPIRKASWVHSRWLISERVRNNFFYNKNCMIMNFEWRETT